jgi:N,N'-diacetyllegionaminate synthase
MQKIFNLPYIIFEVANVHGGSRERLCEIISEYKRFAYHPKAIKFQPFEAAKIALPDFSWFKTYQELYFEPPVWTESIAMAAGSGEVWLDLFDTYGVKVLEANQARIAGIKLQASVLDNNELVDALSRLDLKLFRLMINVSGHELTAIEGYVKKFSQFDVAEMILQIGFQSYPTSIADTGLQKIAILKAAFPNLKICFADHAPAELPVARQIPAWAVMAGCAYIEKHFCLRRSETKYDKYAALEPAEFMEMLETLGDLTTASNGPFISTSEIRYLKNSYQAPIARHSLPAGSLAGTADLLFRRTNQSGLTMAEIDAEQVQFRILARPIRDGSCITKGDFKWAKIAAIVACRMKSSRLRQKALLPLLGVPSVERCLQNCLSMPHVKEVILATSTLEEDKVLKDHTLGDRVQFWQGDPEDVIHRYLGACDKYEIDVIVRVTADCPVVSPEITDILLKSHFANGADYTGPKSCAVGSSPEIYNTEALQRVIALLGKANHSEYMTWYMRNNAHVFKVNIVDLPLEFQRNYRLTLDHPEDLEMFNRLYSALDQQNLHPTLNNVFSVLDGDRSIPSINQHVTLAYQTDQALINNLNMITRISGHQKK